MRYTVSRWMAWLACLSLLLLGPGALAEEKEPGVGSSYALLIVGDEANAEMLREEKVLIAELTRLFGTFTKAQALQVYSYHFNKERERVYCETSLNILREDLLFVGIVELQSKVPRRVVYRLDRLVNARRSARDVLARAEELLTLPSAPAAGPAPAAPATAPEKVGEGAAVTPPRSPAAPAAPTSTPSVAPGGAFRVQLGSFADLVNAQELLDRLRDRGYQPRLEETTRAGARAFRVYLGGYPTRGEAQRLVEQLKRDGFENVFIPPQDGAARPRAGAGA